MQHQCHSTETEARGEFQKTRVRSPFHPHGAPVAKNRGQTFAILDHCEIRHIVRLEEECHNFLYEAKNFVRDFLKAFNILYGATFAEASNYFRPATPKNGKQSLIWYAETSRSGIAHSIAIEKLRPNW